MTADVLGGPLEIRFEPPGRGCDASTPPLVFLHEGLGSVALWRSFPDELRAATGNPTTLVYSRHGHGRSGPVTLPRPVSYMHHEADVVLPALLERYGIERPILVGHSDGASIALLYAGAGHPVTALVLLAPHVFVEDLALASIANFDETAGGGEIRERMRRYHDNADATLDGWRDVWLSPEFRSWSIEDRLDAIDAPMLLIQGESDPYGTFAQLDAIERNVSGPTTRVLFADVGHAPHLERPDETLTLAADFINTFRAASQSSQGRIE